MQARGLGFRYFNFLDTDLISGHKVGMFTTTLWADLSMCHRVVVFAASLTMSDGMKFLDF